MHTKIKISYISVLFIAFLSTSCEYGREAEKKLNEFNTQAEDLNSLVNDGIGNLTDLDSILPETSKKLKKADSIMNDASVTLDSLNQKMNDIKNFFN